ncbi:hypothetical protein [Paracoccus lutimaris]|uniref:Uncharacterized protein n=1 Tax=Paracoccus lutimaris TaxID=1490030 RepID=A0A368YPH7_9RHOB|nr:hypothetical protein [Paracoccus lutimaris]RCW80807.1 hypothetical protein DFP89_11753 [Paracoccus lutimaris]
MDNLQKSEAVIARILAYLAENGLQRSQLESETLALEDELSPFFTTCYEWLESEGIVRSSNISKTLSGHIYITNPVITAKGFQLLSQGVNLGGEEKSLGTAVKEVSSGRSYSSIGDFVGGILGGFTKSISS